MCESQRGGTDFHVLLQELRGCLGRLVGLLDVPEPGVVRGEVHFGREARGSHLGGCRCVESVAESRPGDGPQTWACSSDGLHSQ